MCLSSEEKLLSGPWVKITLWNYCSQGQIWTSTQTTMCSRHKYRDIKSTCHAIRQKLEENGLYQNNFLTNMLCFSAEVVNVIGGWSVSLVISISSEDVLWLQLGGVLWEAADLSALTAAVATADTQRKDLWHTGCRLTIESTHTT